MLPLPTKTMHFADYLMAEGKGGFFSRKDFLVEIAALMLPARRSYSN